MSVYVDEAEFLKPGGRVSYCHMIATTLEELHQFAAEAGINRCWFHSTNKPHYDLNHKNRALAIANGAQELSSRELLLKGRATIWSK